MNEDTWGVTGHRAKSLGPYNPTELLEYTTAILSSYRSEQGLRKVISGMALCFDQAVVLGAIKLGIPFIAAVPFVGQEALWKEESRVLYRDLLTKAESVHVICQGGYAPHKFQKRNEWIVDNSVAMLALWNGNRHGGTFNCIKYAEKVGRRVCNVWPGWSLHQIEEELKLDF